MKKEVIYYSGFSMGGLEICEILDNKKGRVFNHADEKNKKIVDLQEHKILTFWDKIEEMGVWKWHKKYPYKSKYEQLLDGYQWELQLRDRKGRAKYCSGDNSYPRKFKNLIKELNYLFESKIEFYR